MASILRAVLSISVATVLSRATGYARTMVQAAVLGTGLVANAYNAAGALPNQIYELFMGGILYSIFIPILVGRMTSHGEEDAKDLTNALLTLVLPLLAVVTLLGVIFAEPVVLLATDFGAQKLSPEEARETTELAVLFFRIFVLQILLYGVGTITTGVLQSHRRFFLPTFVPVLVNLIVIASFGGYALLAPSNFTAAVYVLAGGATFGVVVMYGILLVAMYRLGYRPRPRLGHPALLPAARLAGPMVVVVAASVGVQLFGGIYLASEFAAVTSLLYAFTVFSLPYGIFVVSIATAIMPELSEQHARGDTEGYRETLSFGLRATAFVAVPATVGLVTLATPIIGLLYERGEFGPGSTENVANLLVAYSVGLLGFAIYFVLIRAFFSRQNTKTPALLNVGLFALYVVLAYGLSRVMGAVGIALALSGANAALALVGLAATRRDIKRLQGRRLLRSLVKMLVAGAAMYAVVLAGTTLFGTGSGPLERVLVLAAVGGASLVAYLGVAYALKAEELNSVITLLRRRVARTEG